MEGPSERKEAGGDIVRCRSRGAKGKEIDRLLQLLESVIIEGGILMKREVSKGAFWGKRKNQPTRRSHQDSNSKKKRANPRATGWEKNEGQGKRKGGFLLIAVNKTKRLRTGGRGR